MPLRWPRCLLDECFVILLLRAPCLALPCSTPLTRPHCSTYDLAGTIPVLRSFYQQSSDIYEASCTHYIDTVILTVRRVT